MRKIFVIILTVLASTHLQAQSYPEQAIDVSIGYGMSVPYAPVEYYGEGFYAQGEYVFNITRWFDLRPYAGLILTKMSEEPLWPYLPGDRSTANAFLFGGKARFSLPIKWVAPYMEIGLGGSLGTFETITLNRNLRDSGLIAHLPFSIGLELGPKNNFNFALTYYFVPDMKQYAGAAAIGYSFPIGND